MSEDWFQVQYKMWGAEIEVTIKRRSIKIKDITQELLIIEEMLIHALVDWKKRYMKLQMLKF